MDVPPEGPRSRRPLWFALVSLSVVAVAVAAGAIAGIGPFDGEEGEELTADEVATRGDEICTEGREQFAELQRDPPQSADEAAELTRQLVEITEEEMEGLRAMNVPDGVQGALDRYLEAREQGLAILRDGLEAAEEEDAEAYADAQAEIADSQVERARLAKEVGFTECSRPLTAEAGE